MTNKPWKGWLLNWLITKASDVPTAPTLLCHIFINNYERFVGVITAAGFLSDRKNAQVSTLTNEYKIKIVPKGFMSDTSPSFAWVGTRLKAEAQKTRGEAQTIWSFDHLMSSIINNCY